VKIFKEARIKMTAWGSSHELACCCPVCGDLFLSSFLDPQQVAYLVPGETAKPVCCRCRVIFRRMYPAYRERIGVVWSSGLALPFPAGSFWDPKQVDMELLMRQPDAKPARAYRVKAKSEAEPLILYAHEVSLFEDGLAGYDDRGDGCFLVKDLEWFSELELESFFYKTRIEEC
jgi:hypothetical protein